MKNSKNNIKFLYLYRDAGNYKQFGDIVFSNPSSLDISEIENTIRKYLIDGEFFQPLKWNIPLIYENNYDPTIDHDWYEFISIESTQEKAVGIRNIQDFLNCIKIK